MGLSSGRIYNYTVQFGLHIIEWILVSTKKDYYNHSRGKTYTVQGEPKTSQLPFLRKYNKGDIVEVLIVNE